MKKLYVCILLIGLCFLLSSCSILFALLRPHETALQEDASASSVTEKDVTDSSTKDDNDNLFEKEFGSYTIPDGWGESDTHSTSERFFYVENGKENETHPDNISVNVGTNPYSADDHMDFRDAIQLQLFQQIAGEPNATLTGGGWTTEQGYVVYAFTIDESEDWAVWTQYYIVGEYKYCMVYLTNFDGAEEADKAAKAIVDSFVWAEE